MDLPEHLQVTTTDRGFDWAAGISGSYGETVNVYESSAAAGPHLWLKVGAHIAPMDEQGQFTGPPQFVQATAHLNAEAAWKLGEQLMFLAMNHYQGDSRPPLDQRVADFIESGARAATSVTGEGAQAGADLNALLGREVTVSNPNGSSTWQGTAVAWTDRTSILVETPDGRVMLPAEWVTLSPNAEPTT